MKLKTSNRYIAIIIGWLIVIEGLANILMAVLPQFDLSLDRILIHYLHYVRFFELQRVTNVLAVFIGIAFIALGRGLAKRQRSSWRITIGFLLFTIVNSIFPSLFLPTFIYTVLMLILLLACSRAFNVSNMTALRTQQWLALISIIFVLTYGAVGTYLLRAQYEGLHDWVDAIYFSLVTYTTIGYGDIVPLTDNAKIFTCSMIILGVSTFVAAISVIFGPIFEKRLKGVLSMVSRLNNLEAHVIIFGANAMGLHTAKLLKDQGKEIVFLDPDSRMLADAESANFKVVLGAASKEDVLRKAQLTQAQALICTSTSDAENLLVVMAAHALRLQNKAKFRIIARIETPEHIPFAKIAGADEVISPSMLMGDSISKGLES